MEGLGDDLVHVVVAVAAEPSAEDDVGRFGRGECAVTFVEGIVRVVTDWIERFAAELIGLRVFASNNGLRGRLQGEVFVLDDPREWPIGVGIVDDRCALEVAGELFRFKSQRAVFERAEAIVEELVDLAGVDEPAACRLELALVAEEVDTGLECG